MIILHSYIVISFTLFQIYDVLKGKGHQFILTNYNRWTFGSLSRGEIHFLSTSPFSFFTKLLLIVTVFFLFQIFDLDYTMACATEPYQANILDHNFGSIDVTYKGCNVVELLVYWTQMARSRIPDL